MTFYIQKTSFSTSAINITNANLAVSESFDHPETFYFTVHDQDRFERLLQGTREECEAELGKCLRGLATGASFVLGKGVLRFDFEELLSSGVPTCVSIERQSGNVVWSEVIADFEDLDAEG